VLIERGQEAAGLEKRSLLSVLRTKLVAKLFGIVLRSLDADSA